jgi:hypothetical protein
MAMGADLQADKVMDRRDMRSIISGNIVKRHPDPFFSSGNR